MTLRKKLYHIIFGTDSKAGKTFDIVLLYAILLSVIIVMIESVPSISNRHFYIFSNVEYFFTILFTIEYILRVSVHPRPLKYVFSFWGLVDLLSVLPTYLSFIIAGYHYLLVVRLFRLLRVFRVLKLARYTSESTVLVNALKSSRYKISVFFITVITIVTIMGTLMYVAEGGAEGYTSIPQSIYWAIVTVTTVGYGDIVPHTVFGKFLSSVAMILGYAIIAVPTGIITVELGKSGLPKKVCPKCKMANEPNANYCNNCGTKLPAS